MDFSVTNPNRFRDAVVAISGELPMREVLLAILNNNDGKKLLLFEFTPEEIFGDERLAEWAEENGYVKGGEA